MRGDLKFPLICRSTAGRSGLQALVLVMNTQPFRANGILARSKSGRRLLFGSLALRMHPLVSLGPVMKLRWRPSIGPAIKLDVGWIASAAPCKLNCKRQRPSPRGGVSRRRVRHVQAPRVS